MCCNLNETPKLYLPVTGAVNVFDAKSLLLSNNSVPKATSPPESVLNRDQLLSEFGSAPVLESLFWPRKILYL